MLGNLATPRRRIVLAIALGTVVAFGLASREYGAVLPGVVAANAGDALWTVAVYLTVGFCFPRWNPVRIGALALGVSFVVEVGQLVEWEWLVAVRSTLPGRLLLGVGFVWADLGRYLAGAVVATTLDWLWTRGDR